jgi:hypothetical protein
MLPSPLLSTSMELTKEHFDQVVSGLATKNELAGLVTKVDATSTEKRIIKRIDEAQGELARMVTDGFVDIQNRLDVSDQIQSFEHKFKKLEEVLHIKL